MRGVRRFAVGLLCGFCMAYPARAKAESKAPIELKWNALESCPSADTVLARVHKIAGTTRPTPNTLRAEATITQPSDGLFRLRLEIRYGDLAAVRDIEGKSCKDLAGAAAVALALLLSSEEPLTQSDLSGASAARTTTGATTTGATTTGATTTGQTTAGAEQSGEQQPQPASPDPAAKATVTGKPPPAPPPNVAATSPRSWRLLLVAPVGALGVGPLPELSLGLGAALGVSFDRWQFLVEGKLWASQRETIINAAEHELEFNRFTVGARGCRGLLGPTFELAPCLLTSVHHLSVQGGGDNLAPNTDTVTWAAVGLGAQARLLVSPWFAFIAGIDGEVQLSRPEVSITVPAQGITPFPTLVPTVVERFAPVAATITIGSQWIF